ncbi:MAG: DUF29 domain-containing protein [Cyanophyceae cyanobacterium]
MPDQVHQKFYDQDFLQWCERTVSLLKEHRFDELELESLIDEVDSLGKSQKQQLYNRLNILLVHLLCLRYWIPKDERERCSRGWRLTVDEQQRRIKKLLKTSPSLNPYLETILEECYSESRERFLLKSGMEFDLEDIVPQENPFELDQLRGQ